MCLSIPCHAHIWVCIFVRKGLDCALAKLQQAIFGLCPNGTLRQSEARRGGAKETLEVNGLDTHL